MISVAIVKSNGGEADRLVAAFGLPADAQFAASRRSPEKYRQRLVARALTRRLLTEAGGAPADAWTLGTDADAGRPFAQGPSGRLAVSTAHSRELVAAIVADGSAAGIDVEGHLPGRDVVALAATAFGPAERALVAADGAAAFYRIWTLREALAKAGGGGFAAVVDGRDRIAALVGGRVAVAGLSYDVAHAVHAAGFSVALALPSGGGVPPLDAVLRHALDRF